MARTTFIVTLAGFLLLLGCVARLAQAGETMWAVLVGGALLVAVVVAVIRGLAPDHLSDLDPD